MGAHRKAHHWVVTLLVIGLLTLSGLAIADDSGGSEEEPAATAPPAAVVEGPEGAGGEPETPEPETTEPTLTEAEQGQGPPWDRGEAPWEAEGEEGPPWLLEENNPTGWRPGDGAPPWLGSPPPWADGSDDDGDGPPFLDEARNPGLTWQPGRSVGPPPWADRSDEEETEDTGDEGDEEGGPAGEG